MATVPSFTKGQDDAKSLLKMFGQLITEDTGVKNESSAKPWSAGPAGSFDSQTLTPIGQSGWSSNATQRYLISSPSFQSELNVNNDYPRIACLSQDLAWVQTSSKTLKLLDRGTFSVKDTMKLDFDLKDMTVTSNGDFLLVDKSNCCIQSISRQKTISRLFWIRAHPRGLCCLPNNDIVMTYRDNSKVLIYSKSSFTKYDTRTLDHIKFRYAKKVAVNKVNQDIYICDCEKESYKSPGKAIAVGADGQLRYEYSGQGDSKLTPTDVCADTVGHVLITDYNNERIHILDQEGQFMQYIMTSQYRPKTIDVDNEGNVWLGGFLINSSTNQIRVARYIQ